MKTCVGWGGYTLSAPPPVPGPFALPVPVPTPEPVPPPLPGPAPPLPLVFPAPAAPPVAGAASVGGGVACGWTCGVGGFTSAGFGGTGVGVGTGRGVTTAGTGSGATRRYRNVSRVPNSPPLPPPPPAGPAPPAPEVSAERTLGESSAGRTSSAMISTCTPRDTSALIRLCSRAPAGRGRLAPRLAFSRLLVECSALGHRISALCVASPRLK